MSFKWLENKTWARFMVLVLSLLPLLSGRMSKFVKDGSVYGYIVSFVPIESKYTLDEKNLPGLLEPNKWKGCLWPKSTEFSEMAPEICQIWEWKPQSISPFPLADRLLRKNRRCFPADILSVSEKKNPHELMWILRRMILPKNTIVSTGFFDRLGRFLQHLLTIWSCVCDLTFLFLLFGV